MANEILSDAEFEELLQSCSWKDGKAVSDIVAATHTNVMFNGIILEKQMECDGAARYFSNFFGTRLWEDGQGMDEVREYATPPYIPISFEYFIQKMKPCKGANYDECDWDSCVVPEGGRGTLPGFQLFEWGFETQRQCIANIRHIRDFRYWASRVIENRRRMDEQVMNMFFTLMAWKTVGHKVVMEYAKSTSAAGVDIYTPWPSADPRNPFRGFRYNYMEEFFPAVGEPSNIGPLSVDSLKQLARTWTHNCNDYYVAEDARGGKIWELWYSEDWFLEEAIENPDYLEKIKLLMPEKMFAGYSNKSDRPREVYGNFAMKTMPWLPKLTESTDGGLIPVDTHTGVDIEFGQEFLLDPAWQHAPFGMALIPSPKQGSIITRSDLTTSPEGFPILPITSATNWRIRNDYDKECNKHLNKPYSEKHYEMGMQMDDPDAAMALIHRFRLLRVNPENFCDLQPVVAVDPNTVCNDFLQIGCHRSGKKVHQASVTKVDHSNAVSCTAQSCGNTDSAPFIYQLSIQRVANKVNFNSLGCACGSTVVIIIGDANGDAVRVQNAIVMDLSQVFPDAIVWVSLETDIDVDAGECIQGIICEDSTPTVGTVLSCRDTDAGEVSFVLDSVLDTVAEGTVAVNDDVTVKYYDADGVLLGSHVGNIEAIDEAQHKYTVSSAEAGFSCSGTTAIPLFSSRTLTLV
jgi:hypothetical protein